MNQFFIVLNQLISFLIMMLIGFSAGKLKIVNEEFLDGLSRLIMRIILPILIFTNAVIGATLQDLIQCYPVILLSIGMYIGLIIVFYLITKGMKLKGDRGRVYEASMIFGNAGFIGIPLLMAIFPERGALYIVLMSIVDQTFLWTYGVNLTTPQKDKQKFNFKNFINPALCAVMLSLIVIILGIHLPNSVLNPLATVGRASTPLSLIYLGGLFYFCNWKSVLKEKELYIGIIAKMIIFPVIFYYIAKIFCSEIEMVRAIAVISGLPTMTTIAMFTKSKNNNAEYAVGTVLITTAVCLITMTIVSYIIF
ncbi:MAG: AEC family transporter [Clostridium sp.]|nr:AEC family transporter [Clostridium sp.]